MQRSLFSSPETSPVLATVAPAPIFPGAEPPTDSEIVTGCPMYDHVGVLYHKRHLLWRKKMVATQGPFLLIFDTANPSQMTETYLRMVAHLASDGVALAVNVNALESLDQPLTFELTGPSLRPGAMLFKALSMEDCSRWCRALRVAINGRCERCVVQPAKSPQHKYCDECTKLRRQEKEDERARQAIERLRRLMGMPEPNHENPPRQRSSLSRVMPAIHYSGQRSSEFSEQAFSQCPSLVLPTSARNGRLDPLPASQSRSASLSLRPLSAPFSDDDADNLAGQSLGDSGPISPLPSSDSNLSILSTSSALRRAGGRIPGLLPIDLDRLTQSQETPSPDSAEPANCLCGDRSSTVTPVPATKLPGCGHRFHAECLREWLLQQATCPKCGLEICPSDF